MVSRPLRTGPGSSYAALGNRSSWRALSGRRFRRRACSTARRLAGEFLTCPAAACNRTGGPAPLGSVNRNQGKDADVPVRRDVEYTEYVSARLPSLLRLAQLLCHDWQRADDLVQAAITRLYVRWARAAAADNLDAYVRTILFREFLHERRSGWASRVSLTSEVPDTPTAAAD